MRERESESFYTRECDSLAETMNDLAPGKQRKNEEQKEEKGRTRE